MHLRGRVGLIHRGIACLAACLAVAGMTSCSGTSTATSSENRYRQINLAASSEASPRIGKSL